MGPGPGVAALLPTGDEPLLGVPCCVPLVWQQSLRSRLGLRHPPPGGGCARPSPSCPRLHVLPAARSAPRPLRALGRSLVRRPLHMPRAFLQCHPRAGGRRGGSALVLNQSLRSPSVHPAWGPGQRGFCAARRPPGALRPVAGSGTRSRCRRAGLSSWRVSGRRLLVTARPGAEPVDTDQSPV